MKTDDFNTNICVLGEANISSPLKSHGVPGEDGTRFISDDSRITVDVQVETVKDFIKKNRPLPLYLR